MGRKLLKLKWMREKVSRMEIKADLIRLTTTTQVASTPQTKISISPPQCEIPVTKHPYPSNHTAPSILFPHPHQSTKNIKFPSQLRLPPSVPSLKPVVPKHPPHLFRHPLLTTKLDDAKHDHEVQVGNDV